MQDPQLKRADAQESVGSAPALEGLPDGNADEEAHKRAEAGALHWIKLVAILFIPALAGVCVLVYVLHMLLPESYRWLCDEDLSALRSLSISVLTGVLSSLAIGYFVQKR